MEFRIQQSEFLRGLRLAQSIADRKSTMPMLANVLLRANGKDQLLVAATDLNVSLSAELQSKNTSEGGLTLGAKALYDIVANMPGDDVVIRRAENNWAEIRAGKVEYRLVGMPDRDFPKMPDHREAEYGDIEAGVLREMIEKTLISVCNDETRFHLNGVLFECDGERGAHGLDRRPPAVQGGAHAHRRPSLRRGHHPEEGPASSSSASSTPPAAPASSPSRRPTALSERATSRWRSSSSRPQFPPYEQVIPKTSSKRGAGRPRCSARGPQARRQLMSSETRGVKFALATGALHIAGDNPDIGEVHEELEAEYDGEAISIGFNPKYVVELLGQMAHAAGRARAQRRARPGHGHAGRRRRRTSASSCRCASDAGRALIVEALKLAGVRNLASCALEPGPHFNVFHGNNGQGKTNLLESLYVVGTLRSFRTQRLAELVAVRRADEAYLGARVRRGGLVRKYEVTLAPALAHGARSTARRCGRIAQVLRRLQRRAVRSRGPAGAARQPE